MCVSWLKLSDFCVVETVFGYISIMLGLYLDCRRICNGKEAGLFRVEGYHLDIHHVHWFAIPNGPST